MFSEAEIEQAIEQTTTTATVVMQGHEIKIETLLDPFAEMMHLNAVQRSLGESDLFSVTGIQYYDLHQLFTPRSVQVPEQGTVLTFNLTKYVLNINITQLPNCNQLHDAINIDYNRWVYVPKAISEYLDAWKNKLLTVLVRTQNQLEISPDRFSRLADGVDSFWEPTLKQYYTEMSKVGLDDVKKHQQVMKKFTKYGYPEQIEDVWANITCFKPIPHRMVLEKNGFCSAVISQNNVRHLGFNLKNQTSPEKLGQLLKNAQHQAYEPVPDPELRQNQPTRRFEFTVQ